MAGEEWMQEHEVISYRLYFFVHFFFLEIGSRFVVLNGSEFAV